MFSEEPLSEIQLLPKIKVELVVEESQLDAIVDLIIENCSIGSIGDGKVFIYPVEEAIRIRTGEHGREAVL